MQIQVWHCTSTDKDKYITEPTDKHRSLSCIDFSLCCSVDGLKGIANYLFLLLFSLFTVCKCDRGAALE